VGHAHGVEVAEDVGRRNLALDVGVVYQGVEKVGGLGGGRADEGRASG